jgi:hypothetical protein
MHEHVRAFVKSAVEAFALAGPVYEFGYCPSGAAGRTALRDCFPDAGYIGCDLCDEGNAGHLGHFARLPFSDGVARTVVCVNVLGQVFERRARPAAAHDVSSLQDAGARAANSRGDLKTSKELTRLLAPGGGMLIVATLDAGSGDCRGRASRIQPGLVRQLLPGLEVPLVAWQGDLEAPDTVYAVGIKPPLTAAILGGTRRFLKIFPARLDRLAAVGHEKPLRWRDYLAVWRSGCVRRQRFAQIEFLLDLPRSASLQDTPAEYAAGATGTRLDLTDGG